MPFALLSRRTLIVGGVLVAFAALAITAAFHGLGFVRGKPVVAAPTTAVRRPTAQVALPYGGEQASPAGLDDFLLDEFPRYTSALDDPGPLLPVFQPLVARTRLEEGTSGEAINEVTLAKLEDVRGELEALGADYVALELLSDRGEYRFHCRMRLSDDTSYQRDFEASNIDPLFAAESVLDDVSAWQAARTAAVARKNDANSTGSTIE